MNDDLYLSHAENAQVNTEYSGNKRQCMYLDSGCLSSQDGGSGLEEKKQRLPFPSKPTQSPTSAHIACISEKDFHELSNYVKRVCSDIGEDIGSFSLGLSTCSRELKHVPAMHTLFDLGGVPIPARQASTETFIDADDSITKDLRLIYDWQEGYLKERRNNPVHHAEVLELTREKVLDDILQNPAIAMTALLCAEFGGINRLYNAFIKAVQDCLHKHGNDPRGALVMLVDSLLQQVDTKRWKSLVFEEKCCDIPKKYAHIFPDTVHVVRYVPEGLQISYDLLVSGLVYADQMSYTRMEYKAMYSSHVMLLRNGRYTLYEDFLFGCVPIGDDGGNLLYSSLEGRCITSRPGGLFLSIHRNGRMNVRFMIDGVRERRFGQHQIVSMAKYQISPSELESLFLFAGISVDHLAIQRVFGQAYLLMLSDWYQQANNKRPRDRETFLGESIKAIDTAFDCLPENRQKIAIQCIKHGNPLSMVRLEGYGKAISQQGLKWTGHVQPDQPCDVWADVEVCDDTFLFEDEQCIWRKKQNKWIFLEDVMSITRMTVYRSMPVAKGRINVNCAMAYTMLYHAITHGHTLSTKFLHHFKLKDIVRHKERGCVQIRVAWRQGDKMYQLCTDHINQNTGDNRPSNLRLVSNRQNIVLAVGNPCQATIFPYSDNQNDDTSVSDGIVVRGETCLELAEKVQEAMRLLKYPDNHLRYSKRTIEYWVYTQELPESLSGKILFCEEKVTSSSNSHDDLDSVDDDMEQQGLSWFVAVFGKKGSKDEYTCVYRGKDNLVRDVKFRLDLEEYTDTYLRDCSLRGFMFDIDEERRRAFVKEHFPRNNECREELRDVYSSHHVCNVLAVYDVHIPDVGLVKDCQGRKNVVLALEISPFVCNHLKSQYNLHGEGDDVVKMKVRQHLTTLVKSYLDQGGNTTFFQDLGVEITTTKGIVGNSDGGKKYNVRFADGSDKLLTFGEIWTLLKEAVSSDLSKGTVRGWIDDSCLSRKVHTTLKSFLRIESINYVPDSDSSSGITGSKQAVAQVQTIDSATGQVTHVESFNSKKKAEEYIYGKVDDRFATLTSLRVYLRDHGGTVSTENGPSYSLIYSAKQKKGKFSPVFAVVETKKVISKAGSEDIVMKHVVSMSKDLPKCIHKLADTTSIVNLINSKDWADLNSLKSGINSGELVCLEFSGYQKNDKSLEDFLIHVMGIQSVQGIIKAIGSKRRPVQIRDWCPFVFTSSIIEAVQEMGKKRVSFRYRAFLVALNAEITDTTSAMKEFVQNKMNPLLGVKNSKEGGDGGEGGDGCSQLFFVLKENNTWESLEKTYAAADETLVRKGLNSMIEKIWKSFELTGKYKSEQYEASHKTSWVKCPKPVQFVSGDEPSTSGHPDVPFLYLPLDKEKHLKKYMEYKKSDKPVFLAFVAEKSTTEM